VDSTVEIRYSGIVVGRASAIRDSDSLGAFINLGEPLPVGTLLTLKLSDSIKEARVEDVIESVDPTVAGMRVRFLSSKPAERSGPHRVATPPPLPPSVVAAQPIVDVAVLEPAAPEPAAPEPAAPEPAAPEAALPEVAAPESASPENIADEGSTAVPTAKDGGPGSQAVQAGGAGGGGRRRRKRR
jgi:hypothetical protein